MEWIIATIRRLKHVLTPRKQMIYTKCKSCGSWGINFWYEYKCGNCGSENTVEYYPCGRG